MWKKRMVNPSVLVTQGISSLHSSEYVAVSTRPGLTEVCCVSPASAARVACDKFDIIETDLAVVLKSGIPVNPVSMPSFIERPDTLQSLAVDNIATILDSAQKSSQHSVQEPVQESVQEPTSVQTK